MKEPIASGVPEPDRLHIGLHLGGTLGHRTARGDAREEDAGVRRGDQLRKLVHQCNS